MLITRQYAYYIWKKLFKTISKILGIKHMESLQHPTLEYLSPREPEEGPPLENLGEIVLVYVVII